MDALFDADLLPNPAYMQELKVEGAGGSPPLMDLTMPRFRIVKGWVKTYQKTGTSPIATLNFIKGDGNEYRDAVFELLPGVTVGEYPISKCRGIKPRHEKELISLYEAVGRKLAWEVTL